MHTTTTVTTTQPAPARVVRCEHCVDGQAEVDVEMSGGYTRACTERCPHCEGTARVVEFGALPDLAAVARRLRELVAGDLECTVPRLEREVADEIALLAEAVSVAVSRESAVLEAASAYGRAVDRELTAARESVEQLARDVSEALR